MRAIWLALLVVGSCTPTTQPDADCDPSTQALEAERTLWVDADEDGFTSDQTELVCAGEATPPGYRDEASDPLDCDDSAPAVYPGAPELQDDGIDQDCDGEDQSAPIEGDVYVDSGDPECQNDTPGSIELPNCTMEIGSTFLEPGGTMLVAGGEYLRERVVSGRTYIGGFDPSDWSHDPANHPTIVRQPEPDGTTILLDALSLRKDGSGVGQTVVEDFTIRGAATTGLTVGFAFSGVENVIARRLDIDANCSERPPEMAFGYSWGIWSIVGGSAVVEDSVVDGGQCITCAAVEVKGGSIELRNTVLEGCNHTDAAVGVNVAGGSEVTLVDVDILIENDDGPAFGVKLTGDAAAFLTGTTVEVESAVEAVGLYTGGAGSRMEVKASAVLVAQGGSPTGSGAVVEENSTMIVGNTLFNGGVATGGDASGLVVRTGGALSLVNSLVDGGVTEGEGLSAALRVDNGALTLVSNDLWGLGQDRILAGAVESNEIAEIDGCGWEGCDEASGNASEDPSFLDWAAGSLELETDSAFIDRGVDPTPYGLIVDRDIVGLPAPADGDGIDGPQYDVGPHER